MARKVDKLRPYRVDYFDIGEIQDSLRSTVVRAVTGEEAKDQAGKQGRIIVRAYRFYQNLPEPALEPVENPLPVKCPTCGIGIDDNGDGDCAVCTSPAYKAIYPGLESSWQPVNDLGNTLAAQADMDAMAEQHDRTMASEVKIALSEWVRSLNDEEANAPVIHLLGVSYTPSGILHEVQAESEFGKQYLEGLFSLWEHMKRHGGDLVTLIRKSVRSEGFLPSTQEPQERHSDPFDAMMAMLQQPPESGPESEATKTVVADLQGMVGHDLHEQMMDNFVPDKAEPKWVGYPGAPQALGVELGRPGTPPGYRSPAYGTHTNPPESCAGCQPPQREQPSVAAGASTWAPACAIAAFVVGILILLGSLIFAFSPHK